METLISRTDYFECDLNSNEFKKDPNAAKQQEFSFRDLPYYVCHLFLTLLYFVVTPMTVN